METSLLESKLESVKPLETNKPYEIKVTPKYEGLKLVKENNYRGGTSIRYWM